MRFSNIVTTLGATLLLAACGGAATTPSAPATAPGGGTDPSLPDGTPQAPTATLSAAQSSIGSGEATTLTWSSTNATACSASGAWSGALAVSGTRSTGPLTQNASYSLTCTGAGGTSAPATAAIVVTAAVPPSGTPPTASLSAKPTSIANGAAATLTWSSTNATSCTASGGWSGTLSSAGTKSTGPLLKNTSFVLTCTGAGGTSAAVTTAVDIVPTVSLSAYPTVVAANATSTLTWSSTNATACTASGGWSGAEAASGTRISAALAATTTYTLVCTGAGGTSTAATATVTVSNAALSVAPKMAALTVTQTKQFAASVPGGGTVTWTVDGVVNGNASVGQVSSTGLYTAGTAPGVHTLLATSTANTAQTATTKAAVTDLPAVPTYHNDQSRDGTNAQEYALTPTSVNTASFGKLASCSADGAIYAQPLWVANLVVNGAKHNVVYAATEHDGLFAFDADSAPCVALWSANLIDAAHGGAAGETPVPSALVGVGAGDISPEIGITGTPVIDSTRGILYVVTKSVNAAHTAFYQRVHAIDLATGNEKPGSPLLITGTYPGTGDGGAVVTFNSRQHLQRAGLALVNGLVYVAFTAHEDKAPWYGWMMSYQYDGSALTRKAVINVAPNLQQSGIWMSGGAPSVDANNNLYFLTGNGDFDATSTTAPNNDYGDSLLQVNASLVVKQWFTPSNEAADNSGDVDFGAGGATVLADLPNGNTVTHALICAGKDGGIYVLNRDLLGGFGDGVAVQRIVLGYKVFATGAFWNDNFYIGGVSGPIEMFKLNTATAQFTLNSRGAHNFGFAGATPSVSASGAQNGIIWSLDTGAYCTNQSRACGPVVLYAYDAANVATELWDSSKIAADAAGYAIKFTVPTVANGKVYVGTRGNNRGGANTSTSTPGELDIYGLKP